ncbi:MAG: DUF4266 domain-containing protein [Deltaproteobacteria bacterium]|nr:DUF4266 domain-containing protein [Nannocystaceae bacterium]
MRCTPRPFARRPPAMLRGVAVGLVLAALGCSVVPQNRREYLADPTMQVQDDPLEARASRKLWTSREGAAGGDAKPAGGGCGCSN